MTLAASMASWLRPLQPCFDDAVKHTGQRRENIRILIRTMERHEHTFLKLSADLHYLMLEGT